MMIYITGAPNGCNEFFVTATVGDRRLISWINALAQNERCTGGLLPEPQEWDLCITNDEATELVGKTTVLGGVITEQLSPDFANVVFRCILPISIASYDRYALEYKAFARIDFEDAYRLVMFKEPEHDRTPLVERLVSGPSFVQDLFIEDDNISVIGSERARLLSLQ